MVGSVVGVQPVRKPFLFVKIDGTLYKSGDNIVVNPNQVLKITSSLEGGRKDYVKFPETYADILPQGQILQRDDSHLLYRLNGEDYEWRLKNLSVQYLTDSNIKVEYADENSADATLTVISNEFPQSYVRVILKATWELVQGENSSLEENVAEAIIYLNVSGANEVWFNSRNIVAKGIPNDSIRAKANLIQQSFDEVEANLAKLNFSVVPASIRTLQSNVNALHDAIHQAEQTNPGYKTTILIIGLPSDQPYKDIERIAKVKAAWDELGRLLQTTTEKLETLNSKSKSDNEKALEQQIKLYYNWRKQISQDAPDIFNRYLPEINQDEIQLPGNLYYIGEEKYKGDFDKNMIDFKTFITKRNDQYPEEIAKINNLYTRLQAVKLFDGMLRSYFASATWYQWQNNRQR
jgi:hypothetical protein